MFLRLRNSIVASSRKANQMFPWTKHLRPTIISGGWMEILHLLSSTLPSSCSMAMAFEKLHHLQGIISNWPPIAPVQLLDVIMEFSSTMAMVFHWTNHLHHRAFWWLPIKVHQVAPFNDCLLLFNGDRIPMDTSLQLIISHWPAIKAMWLLNTSMPQGFQETKQSCIFLVMADERSSSNNQEWRAIRCTIKSSFPLTIALDCEKCS
jgi:hypothetical protein